MRLRRLLIATLVGLATAVVAPVAAWAAAPLLSAPAEGIDWVTGTVNVSASYPAGAKSVIFAANGQPFANVPVVDAAIAGTVSSGVPFRLKETTEFSADARDAQDASLGVATRTLTPRTYTPSAPSLALATGAIVTPSFTLQARSDRTVTHVTVTAGPEPMTKRVELRTGARGRISVPDVRMPYGVEKLHLTASNGFGSSPPSRAKTVYNLGSRFRLPKQSTYVLVDKRSMTLYDVRHNLVVRHYDIAVGTPSTPTPNGYFKIGGARPSSGAWGPMRRPLYRFGGSKLWPSGFYIHGTDAPWDIGTWASHGCVRLYDWAIRLFSKTVPDGTVVLIRR